MHQWECMIDNPLYAGLQLTDEDCDVSLPAVPGLVDIKGRKLFPRVGCDGDGGSGGTVNVQSRNILPKFVNYQGGLK